MSQQGRDIPPIFMGSGGGEMRVCAWYICFFSFLGTMSFFQGSRIGVHTKQSDSPMRLILYL